MRNSFVQLAKGESFIGSSVLQKNIIVMIFFTLIMIFSLVFANFSLYSNYARVKNASQLRIDLLSLENSLIDQETGQRGYLITKNSVFLEPFNSGTLEYQTISTHLLKQINDFPELQRDVNSLIEMGNYWRATFGEEQIRQTMSGQPIRDGQLLAGKKVFDSFRAEQDDLMEKVEALRIESRKYMLTMIGVILCGIGIVILLFQWLLLYIMQRGMLKITKPIIQLEQALTSYENGNINTILPDYLENNEIGRLFQSFRHMQDKMDQDQHLLAITYKMINKLNQAKSLEEVYQNTLTSLYDMVGCERITITTINSDRSFSVKASLQEGLINHREIRLTKEQEDLRELVNGGFSMIHEDWDDYRPKGVITDVLYEEGIRCSLHILLRKEARVLGVINFMSKEAHSLGIATKNRIEKLAPMIATVMESTAEAAKVRKQASKDGLTSLWNRRYFDESLSRLMDEYSDTCDLSLILLDIDHFKRFNDTWGHLEGDDVLKNVATIMTAYCRTHDIVTRFGGEEFAILLPEATLQEAYQVAERIRRIIEVDLVTDKYNVTASMGVARWQPGQTDEEFITMADKGLYQAKHTGRNKVVIFESNDQADSSATACI